MKMESFRQSDLSKFFNGCKLTPKTAIETADVVVTRERFCVFNNKLYFVNSLDKKINVYNIENGGLEDTLHYKIMNIPNALHPLDADRLIVAAENGVFLVDLSHKDVTKEQLVLRGHFRDVHVNREVIAALETGQYESSDSSDDDSDDNGSSDILPNQDSCHIISTNKVYNTAQFSLGHNYALSVLVTGERVYISDGEFCFPYLCVADASGHVMVADWANQRLQILDTETGAGFVLPEFTFMEVTDAMLVKPHTLYVLHNSDSTGGNISVFTMEKDGCTVAYSVNTNKERTGHEEAIDNTIDTSIECDKGKHWDMLNHACIEPSGYADSTESGGTADNVTPSEDDCRCSRSKNAVIGNITQNNTETTLNMLKTNLDSSNSESSIEILSLEKVVQRPASLQTDICEESGTAIGEVLAEEEYILLQNVKESHDIQNTVEYEQGRTNSHPEQNKISDPIKSSRVIAFLFRNRKILLKSFEFVLYVLNEYW